MINLLQSTLVPLYLVASLCPHTGYSQQQSIKSINAYNYSLTTENGLSQNNVSCVIKDGDGFIWMGTGDGLNRFDGYTFVHYTHSDSDSSSLSNNAIINMLLDRKGRLWVGTFDGLNLFDSERQTFRKFLVEASGENTDHNTIIQLLEDVNNQLWVATYGEIYIIDLETLNVKTFDHKNDSTGLSSVNSFLEDRNGKVWAATDNGIYILGATGIIERVISPSENKGGLPFDNNIISMVQDESGSIYFGTNGNGVLQLSNENDQTFERLTSKGNKPFLGSEIIGALAIDNDGKLLIGTDGAGIYTQDNSDEFVQIFGNQSRRLHHGNIVYIFVDERNTYWLCLYGGGVQVVYAGTNRRFEHFRYFDVEMERLEKNSVLAIVEDQQKKIWIGTDGSGLYQFDPESKLFTAYRHSTDKNSISSNVVKSLLVDEFNNIYVGTFGGGLNYLNTKTGEFTRYVHVASNNESIGTNHVWSLLQDSNHRIYVGQLAGLDEFFPEKKIFKPLHITGLKFTPPIFCLEEDRSGNIWIGTRLDGIYRYNPKRKEFKSFLHKPGDSTSMPTNEIVSMEVSSNGKFWIGTGNKGLVLLDPLNLRVEQIPGFDKGEFTNILEDDSNNVWFTSADGVYKYNPSTQEVRTFTIADGLQGTQFNEGASLKGSDGSYYFGGTNGLNVFRVENMRDDTTRARVVFTKLNVFNIPIGIKDKSQILSKSISHSESITLQPDQNFFSLEFACLEFNFPQVIKYRYFLEGFDNAWNDANTSRTATYTNLPPGEYTLKISTSSRAGEWHENAGSIKIIIIARWYERLETKIAVAIFLVVLTVSIIHLRTKLLYNKKIKLERLVKARTYLIETQKLEIREKNRKLEHAYEELNTTNEELQRVNLNLEKMVESRTAELTQTIHKLTETDKSLDTFLYRSSHDLRGPISTILGIARLGIVNRNVDELNILFEKVEKTSTLMLRLLKKLVETNLLFRAKCIRDVIQVEEMILDIRKSLEELNPNNIVIIEFENRVGRVLTGDETMLKCIIGNLMENSIIFRDGNDSYAKCLLGLEKEKLIITVIDNGTGIPSTEIDRISEMFYRGSEKSIGNGLGLFMVKKALEILNGTMEIKSVPHVMTTIKVTVPL